MLVRGIFPERQMELNEQPTKGSFRSPILFCKDRVVDCRQFERGTMRARNDEVGMLLLKI